MAVRLKDIASDLNLSKMTISKVLRGQTDVSAETKARVLKRAQELNYRPNVTARSLRTGQTSSAGLMVSSLAHPAVASVAAGLSEVLLRSGYSLVLSSSHDGSETLVHGTQFELCRQVDLLFLLADPEFYARQPIQSEGMGAREAPRIYLGHGSQAHHCLRVGVFDEAIGRAGARHLLQRGCERIAYLRGPRTPGYDHRFASFLQTVRSAGESLAQRWIIPAELGTSEYESALQIGRRLFSERTPPDAVATCTDMQARGIADAAREAGRQIPGQVQILGCGNRVEICQMRPTLSSIDLALEETGRQAARLGLSLLAKLHDPVQRESALAPRVVQRESTRDPRSVGISDSVPLSKAAGR